MPASSKQRERRSGWRGSGAEVPGTLTALSSLRGRWSWRSRPSCHVPAPRGRRSCRGQAPSFKAFFPGVRTSLHVLGPERGHALGWRLPSREVRDLLLNRMIMRERGSFAPRRPKSRSQYGAGCPVTMGPSSPSLQVWPTCCSEHKLPSRFMFQSQARNSIAMVTGRSTENLWIMLEQLARAERPGGMPALKFQLSACVPWTLGRRLNSSVPLTSAK